MEEPGWGLCRRRLPTKCWTETTVCNWREDRIWRNCKCTKKKKLLHFLSSSGKVLKEAYDGVHPPPHLQKCRTFTGLWVPSLVWHLQAERTRTRLLFSFHFRESAGRASYSTDPWRDAQYLCGNVCRHCASREESSHARLSCIPLVHSEWGR